MACLASRIPYGTRITPEALRMVEEAEDFLRDKGVAHCRVRHHGEVARIEVGSRERAVRQQELDVEQQVRQALRELDQIRQSVALQRQAVEVAAQQRRLAVLRYQRGLGSNFDVVDAESSLVTARSALVQLLTTYAVARLDLKRTTGTLDVLQEFAP